MKWINTALLMACLAAIAATVAQQHLPALEKLIGKAADTTTDVHARWSDIVDELTRPQDRAVELLNRDPMRIGGPRLTGAERDAAERHWSAMLAEARAAGAGAASMEGAKAATERAKAASAAARSHRTVPRSSTTGEQPKSVFERSSHYERNGSTYDRRHRSRSTGRAVRRTRR
jgi:hypothetical protein